MNKSKKLEILGKRVFGRLLVFSAAMAALAMAANVRAVVISFETSEGFPLINAGGASSFDGMAVPAGIVSNWGKSANSILAIDGPAPSNYFTDDPAPISGSQIGMSQFQGGSGPNVVTMDLSAPLNLSSLWFAYRGSGLPRFEVDYYDTTATYAGTDAYTAGVGGGVGVGLDAGFNPKFQLITPSASFASLNLSKVVFRSGQWDSGTGFLTGSGSFFLDDITLTGVPEPSSLVLLLAVGAPVLFGWYRKGR